MKRASRVVFVILAFALVASVVFSLSGIRARPGQTTNPQSTPTPTPRSTPTPIPGFLVYADDDNGFSFLYPNDWEQIPEESYVEGVLVAFGGDPQCGSTFTVGRQELPYAVSVQVLLAQQQEYLSTLEGYTHVSDEELMLFGLPAMSHQCQLTRDDVTVTVLQLLVVEGSTAWLVSGECSEECWSSYDLVFDTMLGSFTP
ncbi:MAG: hypothetical protein SVP26_11215 [Chloroflexota bacterium]|nr:hypothetical protein [Chloroflexota bacterium]